MAQVPQSFKYQAVARDGNNTVLKNSNLGLKFEIREGSLNGTVVYSETFSVTSNSAGIFSVNIGNGNPTGGNVDKSQRDELVTFAKEHDLWIISDEVYDRIVYDGAHVSFLGNGYDKLLLVNSFSKTFAMTGWRLGFVAAPSWIIEKMTRFQMYNATCPVTFVQYAAAKALDDPRSWKAVEEMRKEYDRRRNLVWKRLNEMGLPTVKPKGAFYIFPRVRDTGLTSKEFSELMLKEARVAVVPGSAFGKAGEGYIRISYATAYEQLEEAMDRMEKALRERGLV
jgi:aminotransferase